MGCVESATESPSTSSVKRTQSVVRNGSTNTSTRNGSVKRTVRIDIAVQTDYTAGTSVFLRRLSSRLRPKKPRDPKYAEPPDETQLFDVNRTIDLHHSAVAKYIDSAVAIPGRKDEDGSTLIAKDDDNNNNISVPIKPNETSSTSTDGPVATIDKWMVQGSWKEIQKDLANFGINVFVRLLEQYPSVRHLFPFGKLNLPSDKLRENDDLKAHGLHVMETIGVAVDGLDDLDVIVAILEDLGARHNMYGAKPEHFGAIVDTFMYCMQDTLPNNVFTTSVKKAWTNILQIVATAMSSTMRGDVNGLKSTESEEDNGSVEDGPISTQDKALVRRCWVVVQKDLVNFGVVFFVRLLEKNPSVRNLFSFGKLGLPPQMLRRNPDLRAHGQRVMETIGAAVDGLDDLDVVVTILKDLGERHKLYGAKPEHFTAVVDAFMYSLESGLTPNVFTVDVQEAWRHILSVVAGTMSSTMT